MPGTSALELNFSTQINVYIGGILCLEKCYSIRKYFAYWWKTWQICAADEHKRSTVTKKHFLQKKSSGLRKAKRLY